MAPFFNTAAAAELDHAPLKKRSFTQNSRAYMLTFAVYCGMILFGYDTGVGGAVLVLPSFARDFGITGTATEIANLQGNVVSILQGGCFFGAIFAAPLATRFGRLYTLMAVCLLFCVGGIIQTVATTSLPQFYGGRFVCGLAVGAMSMICPTYVSEIAPKQIRGRVTGIIQICIVTGVAISYWINYGVAFLSSEGSTQWRIPIGLQLLPAAVMLCILPFCKESPRWLATKHREDQALRNLAWIRKTSEDDEDTLAEFAEVTAAISEEEAGMAGRVWYKEVTAKGNPIRFCIAFGLMTAQQWSGQNSINYFAPTIFQSIGIKGKSASLLASGVYGIVKIVATIIFIAFGIERFGRKKTLVLGLGLMSLFLWIIGAIFNTNIPDPNAESPSNASIAMAAMIYIYVIPYCFSIGPIPWVYSSEIFNNRTRAYGLALTASSQWFWNFMVSRFTPNMVIALNKGGIFMFFAGINVISTILACFLPETKGLSLESMDLIFGAVTKEEREAEIAKKAAELRHMQGGDEKLDVSGDVKHVERV